MKENGKPWQLKKPLTINRQNAARARERALYAKKAPPAQSLWGRTPLQSNGTSPVEPLAKPHSRPEYDKAQSAEWEKPSLLLFGAACR